MSFSKLCLEMVRDPLHYHKFPWKLKRLPYQKKKNVQKLLVKLEALLQDSLRGTSTAEATRRCTSRGHLLTPKKSLSLLNIKKATWSYILPQTGKYRFKHQILSESNKNCRISQNSQKRSTHEVSGHFNNIWPNFTSPTAEQESSAAVKPETLPNKTEHMGGLKIPLRSSTSSFGPFWHHGPKKETAGAESALPATKISKSSNLRSELTDSLKILPKGSTSNFKSNWHRLTLHQRSDI